MEIKTIDLDRLDPSVKSSKESLSAPINTNNSAMSPKENLVKVIIFILVAVGGFYSGALFKGKTASGGLVGSNSSIKNIQAEIPSAGVKVGDIYGSPDEKAFNTTATGVLDKGGLNGEGTHKLVRPGGVSQTVYMTSSVVDLDILVGDQITVWGETFKGQKVGWLMDVGRVKVENLNVPLPK